MWICTREQLCCNSKTCKAVRAGLIINKVMSNNVNFIFSSEEDRDKFVNHQREYGNPTVKEEADIRTWCESSSDGYTYHASVNQDGINDAATLRQDADLMNGKTEFDK